MSEPLGRVVAGFTAIRWLDDTIHFYAATDDGLAWHYDEDEDRWESFLPPIPHTYAWQREQGTFHG